MIVLKMNNVIFVKLNIVIDVEKSVPIKIVQIVLVLITYSKVVSLLQYYHIFYGIFL